MIMIGGLKKLLVASIILLLILATQVFYLKKHFINLRYPALANTFPKNTKYILYWTPAWRTKDFFIGFGQKAFQHCEYSNCYATDNRKLIPLEEFDAVLVHEMAYNKKKHGIPWARSSHQKYVFMNVEAPEFGNKPLVRWFNSWHINWTMTYRHDSDILRRHGHVIQDEQNYTLPTIHEIKKKKKLAAWFVSHCKTSGHRESLVKALRKYIPVDVYGACGNLTCKRTPLKPSSKECYDMVERDYKFYFSFENSYCTDYATEKLYNILQINTVPVVYSRLKKENLFVPPNSAINVDDFRSARELADYLLYLDQNESEYLKYFEWKKHYRIDHPSKVVPCDICKKLHTEQDVVSTYDDLVGWWWKKGEDGCLAGKNLPKIVADNL